MLINVKRLEHALDLPLPQRMTPGSSGFDIYAAIDSDIIIDVNQRALIPTGFCFEIPLNYEIQVRPRSGLAFKSGITILNTPGTIDSDYRGELKLILINFGDKPFFIKRGDRIAQLILMKLPENVEFLEVDSISDANRDNGGFGHTGI